MKIEIVASSLNGSAPGQYAKISRNGVELLWDISPYSRRDRSESASVAIFDEINAYLAQLPAQTQHQIFELYQQIREDLGKGFAMTSLQKTLQMRVRQLYTLLSFEDLEEWVRRKSGLRVPSTIKVAHAADDPNDPSYLSQTYLYQDYQELMALAVALRPMVPIWGEYIRMTKMFAGVLHKELEALRLLYFTPIVACRPYLRLRDYIVARATSYNKQGPSQATVMGGMGSSETPEWLMSVTVVRRLSVCPIISPDENTHIVTNLHQFLVFNLRAMDRKFGGRFNGSIVDKEKSAQEKDQGNDSLMEMYKNKTELSDGDITKMNVYPDNIQSMIDHLDTTIPMEYFTLCREALRPIEHLQLLDQQQLLVQLVIHRCITAHAIPLTGKQALLNVMAVVQAALWHWEFPSLAVMVTATPIIQSDETILSGMEIRGRMPKDQTESLMQIFKHYRQPRQQNAAPKAYNVAVKTVEAFCAMAGQNEWFLNAPVELKYLATTPENFARYEVTADIRTTLTSLILKITQ
jgi:hypothetical protein